MNKEQLQATMEKWIAPGKIAGYYGNLELAPGQIPFAIEKDSTGYYYIVSDGITYYNMIDGTIYRLRQTWAPHDWKCYNDLYALSVERGTFRIDKPLFQEVILYRGEWEYSELQSPNGEYGANPNDDMFAWKFDSVEYLHEYIDQCVDTTNAIIDVANSNMCGVPAKACTISSRFRDSVGYFWSDIDLASWTGLGVSIKDTVMIEIVGITNFAHAKGYINLDDAKDVVTYAREKWKKI